MMNHEIETLNRFADSWWAWMVSASWQSAVVGLLLLAIVACARRSSSPIRYGLLLIALIKFAVPPLLAAPTGLLTNVGPVHEAKPVDSEPAFFGPSSQPIRTEPVTPASTSFSTADVADSGNSEPTPLEQMPSEPSRVEVLQVRASENGKAAAPLNLEFDFKPTGCPVVAQPVVLPSWKTCLLAVYLLGITIAAFFIAMQLRALRRLVRASIPAADSTQQTAKSIANQLGIRRSIRVLRCDHADSPIAFGAFKPTVILPSESDDYSADDMQTVLGHELAHLSRGDGWISWLQLGLLAAWWFHPVFWLVNRTLRRVREDCCDDLLIASGLTTQDAYCDTLPRLAARPSTAPVHVACSMASLHPLGARLKRIMDPRVRRAVGLSVVNFGLIVLAAGVLLPGLRTQSLAQETAPPNVADAAEQKFEIPKGLPIATPEKPDRFGYRGYSVEFKPLSVSGRCVDSEGKPVTGAEVMLLLPPYGIQSYVDEDGKTQKLDTRVASIRSDQNGHYEFKIDRFPVKQFKPDPLEKPDEASFIVMATAENYAIAWRGEKTVRQTKRPETLDPEEQVKLFFEGEPIELDLTFAPEVIIHGVVSDDLGQPLEDAMVQLGVVSSGRARFGQKPNTMSYEVSKSANKREQFPGFSILDLPERFREARTNGKGEYKIHGMPANASAAVFVEYQPTYTHRRDTLVTKDGKKSRQFSQFVGTTGQFNVTLIRPRTYQVRLTSAAEGKPRCIVRANALDPRAPNLRDGSMTESADGLAKLELPPGKYTLVIEPLGGQSLLSTSREIEVLKEPLQQSSEFKIEAGADVAIRAVVAGTNEPIEGVGFSWESDTTAASPLHSQTAFVDHPRTDSTGIMRATLRPGMRWFIPTTIPDGYAAVEEQTRPLNFPAGTKTIVRVAFEKTEESPEPASDNQALVNLVEKIQQQKKLVSRGRYVFRQRSFLKGDILPVQMQEVLELLEGKSSANAEAILKHVFPQLNLHQRIMLVDRNKIAVGVNWDNSESIPWQGINVSGINVKNGVEQLGYGVSNHQLDIDSAVTSRENIGALSEVVATGPTTRLPPGVDVTERDGRTILSAQGAELMFDSETGFYLGSNIMRGGSGQMMRQYGPVKHANGAVTPPFRIEARFRNNKLDRADVVFVDKAEMVDRFPTGTFTIAAPAGTNVIDRRNVDSTRVRRGHRAMVLRAAVSDVVATVNKQFKPTESEKTKNPAATNKPALKIGDEAPAFDVAGWYDQNGKTTAPDLKDKIAIVNFHENTPSDYVDENRTLRDALTLFEGRNVVIVNVYSHKTDAKKAAAFMKEFNLPWKFAIDKPPKKWKYGAGMTAEAFEVPHPTTTIVIALNGRIRAAIYHSEQSSDAVRRVNQLAPPKK